MLVTGSSGFLGSQLCESLIQEDALVVGLDKAGSRPASDRFRPVEVNIQHRPALEEALRDNAVETVIHLAAQSLVEEANADPVPTFESNVAGTWNLLESCRRIDSIRSVVVASSDKAYGEANGASYDELMPLRPLHPYATSKACTDLIAQTYAATYGLPVAICRCANIYGGGDLNWSRIIPGTIRSILEGQPPIIRSDGRSERDFLYIKDAISGLQGLATAIRESSRLLGQAFNFGTNKKISVAGVVKKILALMSSSLEPVIEDRANNEIRVQQVGASRGMQVLNWKPQYSLEDGLKETIAWYQNNKTLISTRDNPSGL